MKRGLSILVFALLVMSGNLFAASDPVTLTHTIVFSEEWMYGYGNGSSELLSYQFATDPYLYYISGEGDVVKWYQCINMGAMHPDPDTIEASVDITIVDDDGSFYGASYPEIPKFILNNETKIPSYSYVRGTDTHTYTVDLDENGGVTISAGTGIIRGLFGTIYGGDYSLATCVLTVTFIPLD